MLSRDEIERRILRVLERATTKDDLLVALPMKFEEESVCAVLTELIDTNRVALVRTKAREER